MLCAKLSSINNNSQQLIRPSECLPSLLKVRLMVSRGMFNKLKARGTLVRGSWYNRKLIISNDPVSLRALWSRSKTLRWRWHLWENLDMYKTLDFNRDTPSATIIKMHVSIFFIRVHVRYFTPGIKKLFLKQSTWRNIKSQLKLIEI